ncbi:hypothetical protein BDW74DRAFT_63097 [Aspergillus multicolor]|uniref:uncharacterized protein n=1 Tax=Aspergillus multicolor TaxID=41759 RepID=UPI003CCD4DB9
MPFDLMMSLAAAEFQVAVDDSIVFLGYRTVLYPTAIHENSVQFHLLTGDKGQINPYLQNYGTSLLIKNAAQFTKMRYFLGWTTNAQVNLGTKRLPASIRWSGGANEGRSLRLDGYTAMVQAGASAPLQANLSLQADFKYRSHWVYFDPTTVYEQLLADTAEEVVLIYDSNEQRCRLVPKLSLLLHMSQAYASRRGCPSSQIPFVEPYSDATALREQLKWFGNTAILGDGGNALRFKQLLLGLNINLLKTRAVIRASEGKHLYGFELGNIITQPGRGSCMKKLEINRLASKSWISIANEVDAVLVCAGLGDVITAVDEARPRNELCSKVPQGQDYLAATINCLKTLVERRSSVLAGELEPQLLQISDERSWDLSSSQFSVCEHSGESLTC